MTNDSSNHAKQDRESGKCLQMSIGHDSQRFDGEFWSWPDERRSYPGLVNGVLKGADRTTVDVGKGESLSDQFHNF